MAASLGLAEGGVAVDVGCGEGGDAVELARRFGLHVHGIDPVARHVELAAARAEAEGLGGRADFRLGSAEALPVDDASADFVWCKEVLMFTDLGQSFCEFSRVLRPGGIGFVFQFLSGPRMTEAEAAEFWSGELGGGAQSQRASDMEAAIASAGLVLRQRVDFAGEWGEYAQERSGAGGRRLAHASRLLRRPERYIERFGETNYRIMLADCFWHVYRMIGKLEGVAFVFSRSG